MSEDDLAKRMQYMKEQNEKIKQRRLVSNPIKYSFARRWLIVARTSKRTKRHSRRHRKKSV